MTRYQELIDRKAREYGDRFDPSELDPRFVRFYNSGERIRVETCGMTMTGTIGVTTGWRPAFLLMRTARSMGSPWIMGPKDRIVALKRGREYQAVKS